MIWRIITVVLTLTLAVAAVPLLRHWRETPPSAPPRVHAAFQAPAGAELGSGDDVIDAAVAADTGAIVFVATTGGTPALWQRPLASERAERIAGTEGATMPAWKAGGRVVAFFAAGRLRQVALSDGAISDLAPAPAPSGAAWRPDGAMLFAGEARAPIRLLKNGAISDATRFRAGDVAHVAPQGVIGPPGGFTYIAVVSGGRRVARLVHDGGEVDLTRTSGDAALIDGTLLHVLDGALSAQRYDVESGRLAGRATQLAFDVGVSASGRASLAASPRVLVWGSSAPRGRELRWLDARGRAEGTVAEPGDYWQVRLSPDDRTVAVTMVDPLLRTLDVFTLPTAASSGSGGRRVTLSVLADTDPVWSPDGTRIAYRSLQRGQPHVFARPAQFSVQPDEPLLQSELDETPTDWQARPRPTLLLQAPGTGTGVDLWTLEPGGAAPRPFARGSFNESDARWSPDSTLVAYVSDEPGRPEIFVQRWPAGGMPVRLTTAGGTRPRWRSDGRGLYFLRQDALMLAARTGEASFAPAVRLADLPGVRDYDTARRGDRLLAILPGPRNVASRAGLIVNWASTPAEATGR